MKIHPAVHWVLVVGEAMMLIGVIGSAVVNGQVGILTYFLSAWLILLAVGQVLYAYYEMTQLREQIRQNELELESLKASVNRIEDDERRSLVEEYEMIVADMQRGIEAIPDGALREYLEFTFENGSVLLERMRNLARDLDHYEFGLQELIKMREKAVAAKAKYENDDQVEETGFDDSITLFEAEIENVRRLTSEVSKEFDRSWVAIDGLTAGFTSVVLNKSAHGAFAHLQDDEIDEVIAQNMDRIEGARLALRLSEE